MTRARAKIIELHPEERKKASEEKWGKRVLKIGFSIVPSLLLRAQQRLGLNPTQLVVLLQLLDYWWDVDRKPYPSKKTLSERLKISPRQVQRYMQDLERSGFIKREARYANSGGRMSNLYDLAGLVEKLQKLEPEFREVEDEVRRKRHLVTLSGGIRSRESNE